ncbi:hypothetical protein J4731_22260 [Providencia rettgeri]|nr:hypothetical protein [Providencia rettgeri]
MKILLTERKKVLRYLKLKLKIRLLKTHPRSKVNIHNYFMISLNQLKENEVDLLADELSLFGHLYHTEKTANSLQAWVGTNTDIDDISGVLCFVVDESQISHEVISFADCLAFSKEETLLNDDKVAANEVTEPQVDTPQSSAKPAAPTTAKNGNR